MKRAMYSLLSVVVLVGLTGCVNHQGRHPVAGVGGGCCSGPGGLPDLRKSWSRLRATRVKPRAAILATPTAPTPARNITAIYWEDCAARKKRRLNKKPLRPLPPVRRPAPLLILITRLADRATSLRRILAASGRDVKIAVHLTHFRRFQLQCGGHLGNSHAGDGRACIRSAEELRRDKDLNLVNRAAH